MYCVLGASLQKRFIVRDQYNNGTLEVQCPAFPDFAKLRSSPVMTLLSAYFTCAELLTVLLVLRRF